MNVYIISDTHFNHKEKMVKWCGRPENYEELLTKNLRQLTEKDLLIHFGDITIGNVSIVHKFVISQLRCRKILVRGNHDKKSNTWYLNNGWDFVCEEFKDTLFGKNILFSHFPKVWDGLYDINIHGHFHNSDHRRHEPEFLKIKNGYQKLFAVEYEDYKPVKLERFINN